MRLFLFRWGLVFTTAAILLRARRNWSKNLKRKDGPVEAKKLETEIPETMQLVTPLERQLMLDSLPVMRRQILRNWRVLGEDDAWTTLPSGRYESARVYARPRDPEVGMGATVYVGTDRWAGTIVKVSPSLKRVQIQLDKVWRTRNWTQENQQYLYALDPDGDVKAATYRPEGLWRIQGVRTWGACVFGRRDYYQDPEFR